MTSRGWVGRDGRGWPGVGQDTGRGAGRNRQGSAAQRTGEEEDAQDSAAARWGEVLAAGASPERALNTSLTPGSQPSQTHRERSAPTPRTDPAKYSQGHWKCNKAHGHFWKGLLWGGGGGGRTPLSVNFTVNFKVLKKGAVKSPFPVNVCSVYGASRGRASRSGCGVYAECLPLSGYPWPISRH